MKYTEVVLGMVAGLALFLYGVSRLATGMRAVAGDRMRRLLERATTNRFAGVAVGTLATAVLDSSSVTIIMVIALVDAGLLSFQNSLGVILGANIGTTISSQLIALDVQRYSPVVLAVGLLLFVAGRTETWRQTGARQLRSFILDLDLAGVEGRQRFDVGPGRRTHAIGGQRRRDHVGMFGQHIGARRHQRVDAQI